MHVYLLVLLFSNILYKLSPLIFNKWSYEEIPHFTDEITDVQKQIEFTS